MATKLVRGSLKDWFNKENQSEESFLDMYHESIEMFKDHWSSQFDDSESQLKIKHLFSSPCTNFEKKLQILHQLITLVWNIKIYC